MTVANALRPYAAALLLTAASASIATDSLPSPDLSGYAFTESGPISHPIRLLAVDRAGRMLIAGSFSHVNGAAVRDVARIGPDSQVDSSWRAGLPAGFSAQVAVEESDGRWLVAGYRYELLEPGYARHSELHRVDGTGAPSQLLHTAFGGDTISALTVDLAGNIYVAIAPCCVAQIITAPVEAVVHKLSAAGVRDTLFQVRLSGGWGCPFHPLSRVNALAHDGQRYLYIGGNFATATGGAELALSDGIARTATDVASAPAVKAAVEPISKLTCFPRSNPAVHAMALGADGFLYMGGEFGFRRLATSAIGSYYDFYFSRRGGFTSESSYPRVSAVALDLARHRVYVSGNFTAIDGIARPGLAALSTLSGLPLDTAWAPSEGASRMFPSTDRLIAGQQALDFATSAASPGEIAFAFPLAGTSIMDHYYQSILGRPPDPSGVGYWPGEASRLALLGSDVRDLPLLGIDPREVYIAMAMYFFDSPEFLDTPLDDEQFVERLYVTFFNRPADPSGARYWAAELSSGLSRELVMLAFMFSPEFNAYMASILAPSAMRVEVGVVVDFYRGALGRLPDDDGLRHWVSRFRAAQCLQPGQVQAGVYAAAVDISAAFFNSSEHAAASPSVEAYVSDLYNAFMRRGADLFGFSYWVGQIANGTVSRDQARLAFIGTPEFAARVAAIASQPCPWTPSPGTSPTP